MCAFLDRSQTDPLAFRRFELEVYRVVELESLRNRVLPGCLPSSFDSGIKFSGAQPGSGLVAIELVIRLIDLYPTRSQPLPELFGRAEEEACRLVFTKSRKMQRRKFESVSQPVKATGIAPKLDALHKATPRLRRLTVFAVDHAQHVVAIRNSVGVPQGR